MVTEMLTVTAKVMVNIAVTDIVTATVIVTAKLDSTGHSYSKETLSN